MTARETHHGGKPKSRVRRRRSPRRPMIDQSDLDEDDEVEIGGGDERPGKEMPR